MLPDQTLKQQAPVIDGLLGIATQRYVDKSLIPVYPEAVNPSIPTKPSMDWRVFINVLPLITWGTASAMWVLFLLIPSLGGYHYAGLYPALENGLWVLIVLPMLGIGWLALKKGYTKPALIICFGAINIALWF
jgi:hypothetical protein